MFILKLSVESLGNPRFIILCSVLEDYIIWLTPLGVLALLVRLVMLQGTSTQSKPRSMGLPSTIGFMDVYLSPMFVLKDAFTPFISPFSRSTICSLISELSVSTGLHPALYFSHGHLVRLRAPSTCRSPSSR